LLSTSELTTLPSTIPLDLPAGLTLMRVQYTLSYTTSFTHPNTGQITSSTKTASTVPFTVSPSCSTPPTNPTQDAFCNSKVELVLLGYKAAYPDEIESGSTITVGWAWPDSAQFPTPFPTWTVDIYFYPSPKAYGHLLGSFPVLNRVASVTIPVSLTALSNTSLRFTVRQQASNPNYTKTMSITQSIKPKDLCVGGNVQCGTNAHCDASSGTCQCDAGFAFSAQTTSCQLPCIDVCGRGTCTGQTPTTTPITTIACSPKGTDIAATKQTCTKCVCLPGYTGDKCDQLTILGSVVFIVPESTTGTPFITQKVVDIESHLVVAVDTLADDLDWSQFLSEEGLDVLVRDMALSLDIDPEFVSIHAITQVIPQQQQQQQYQQQYQTTTDQFISLQTLIPGTQTTVTYAIANENGATSLDSLTQSWKDLQTNFPNLPISQTEASREIGSPQSASDPIIPSALDTPKRASTTTLIIGLVVGLTVALILFIALICVLLWCRRNQRGFWKSKQDQDKDEISSYLPQQPKTFTGSTSAPKSTIGTSSVTPLNVANANIELSNPSTTTNVQTVNNHTQVNDPTLSPNVKAYKDTKGQIFYVDSNTMTTSWNHPNAKDENNGGYGSDW